jgi:hypothetical protein
MTEQLLRPARTLVLLGLTVSLAIGLALPASAQTPPGDPEPGEKPRLQGFSFREVAGQVIDVLRAMVTRGRAGGGADHASSAPPPDRPGSEETPLQGSRREHDAAVTGQAAAQQKYMDALTMMQITTRFAGAPTPWALADLAVAGKAKEDADAQVQRTRDERVRQVQAELARLRERPADAGQDDEIAVLTRELTELGAGDEPPASDHPADQEPIEAAEHPEQAETDTSGSDGATAYLEGMGSVGDGAPDEPATGVPNRPWKLPEIDTLPEVTPPTMHRDQWSQWFSGNGNGNGILEEPLVNPGTTDRLPPEAIGLPGGGVFGQPLGDLASEGCGLAEVAAFSDCGLNDAAGPEIFAPAPPPEPPDGLSGCGVPTVIAICAVPGGQWGGVWEDSTGALGNVFGAGQVPAVPAEPDALAVLAG